MGGYIGAIAYADLTLGIVSVQPYSKVLKKKYFGGGGPGIRMVTVSIMPDVNPLEPYNVLILSSGPLTNSGVPLGSRYEVNTKFPLNSMLISANNGGIFGWDMKKVGFESEVVTGKAGTPVHLHLTEPFTDKPPVDLVWQREPLLDESYRLCFWDNEGHPTSQKLAEVSL